MDILFLQRRSEILTFTGSKLKPTDMIERLIWTLWLCGLRGDPSSLELSLRGQSQHGGQGRWRDQNKVH